MSAQLVEVLGVLDRLQRGLRSVEEGLRAVRQDELAAMRAADTPARRRHRRRVAELTGQVEGVVTAELVVVQTAAELRANHAPGQVTREAPPTSSAR